MNKKIQWGAICLSIVLFVGFVGQNVQADVLRINPGTPVDVVNCAAGIALVGGVDTGKVSAPGDTCQLAPGTFALPAPAIITLANLTFTSRDGANVTSVLGVAGGTFIIQADGVTIEELSISGSGIAGIEVGPVGVPNEDIRIENNFINGNIGPGIAFRTPGQHEDIHIEGNELRGNAMEGILFDFPVTRVMNVEIVDNKIDSNGPAGFDGISFMNTGNVDNTSVQNNEILRSGGHGVHFAPGVTNVDGVDIDGNVIQANGFSVGGNGVLFANSGQVDANIVNNISNSGDSGINGNTCSGVWFDGAGVVGPFFGGAVTEVDVVIDGNLFSRNGLGASCPGITFINSGNVDDLEFSNNEVDQNASDGVMVLNGSDFSDSTISNNTFSNNGNTPAFFLGLVGGNGFTGMPMGDVEGILFQGNTADQNFIHGSLLASRTSDVQDISFVNEQYSNNGQGLPLGGGVPAGLEVTAFGDITNISMTGCRMQSNGGAGAHFDANGANLAAFFAGVANPGDLTDINIDSNAFGFNGASSPAGTGDGVFMNGETVDNVSFTNNFADTNDDNGLHVNSTDDATDIEVMNNELSNNDRNNDEVGAGARIEANEDVSGVMVIGNTLSNNEDGVSVTAGGQNISNVVIDNNPEINNNNSNGVEVDAPDDLSDVQITNNTITGNKVNILVRSTDRGDDVEISGNRLVGASGTGIALESTGVSITQNDIRNHDVGIIATRGDDVGVHNNNIVRNDMGINASGLGVGEELDATNNWWGEPSGPEAPTNRNGLGDEITSKVKYQPFLTSPVGDTGANFQILDFNAPSNVDVGDSATISARVQNTGTEEGNQDISIQIKDSNNTVVKQETQSTPLNPSAETTISIGYLFDRAGTFQVTVSTGSDSQTKTIIVGDGVGSSSSIASAIDTNGNGRIDDDEIREAVVFWINGSTVPGTGGKRIDDDLILDLMAIWIKGESV